MARPGLRAHPKFRRLVHLLKEPLPHVLGYLECLWEVGYQCGNPVVGDANDVELAAEYPGEPGKLCATLLSCKLIDDLGDGRFQIHDLLENAPDYVRKRAQRHAGRKNKDLRQETADTDRRTAPNGSTPSPAQPSPAQLGGEPPKTPLAVDEPPGGNVPVKMTGLSPKEFLDAWNAVPPFVHARGLTGKRLRYFQARARETDWLQSWRDALDRAAAIPFCQGRNDRGWRATVDWFLRPDTVTKILEGTYDGLGMRGPPPGMTREQGRARTKEVLDSLQATPPASAEEMRRFAQEAKKRVGRGT